MTNLQSFITKENRKSCLWKWKLLVLHQQGMCVHMSLSSSVCLHLCIYIINNFRTSLHPSTSPSPLQNIMNTPKFQLRKLQREILKERDYTEGLESELSAKLADIAQKGNRFYSLYLCATFLFTLIAFIIDSYYCGLCCSFCKNAFVLLMLFHFLR